MKTVPSITIVIPTYKRLGMLAELSQALLPQLEKTEAEVLIIDNCPDGSAHDLVKEYATRSPAIKYLHEPRPGVVHARNTGVQAAKGTYILFLDDDEVPSENWLAAFAALAEQDVTTAYGQITPRYEDTPDPVLKPLLDQLFSRKYPETTGANIAAHYPELGTGNALFHKERCFESETPFDVRFNQRGGEDIFLIKGLVERNETLSWCPDGLVEELVPAPRMKAQYLKERRYNQGQQRCLFLRSNPNLSERIKIIPWMGVGLIQTTVAAGKLALAQITGSSTAVLHKIQMQGGLGKLFWWREPTHSHYAGSEDGTSA